MCICSACLAQDAPPLWDIKTLPTRTARAGDGPTLTLATYAALPGGKPRHLLLYFSSYAHSIMATAEGRAVPAPATLWPRLAPLLAGGGVMLAVADTPSDAHGRDLTQRPLPEIAADIRTAVAELERQHPGVPIHLAGFGPAVGELVWALSSLPSPKRLVIASGDFRAYRTNQWSLPGHPVLIIHSPGAQCDHLPYYEAEYVARKNGFQLMQVGYEQQERNQDCGPRSQSAFAGREVEVLARLIVWLDGAPAPAVAGFPEPARAWREQVLRYDVKDSLAVSQREMTLLLPPGKGPFPVMLFNHGDVPSDMPYIRFRQRLVLMVVAREFLQLGWAVAFPERAGVGLSDGVYKNDFQLNEFNPTSAGDYHAEDIVPAIDFLRAHPDIDGQRVVVSGQSAGGFAAMQIGSRNLQGVVGIINYAGGRTDVTTKSVYQSRGLVKSENAPGEFNRLMINGFAQFGKTTKVPTLLIFAENDSRYSANTIRESHAAFVKSGGKAQLLLTPPLRGDGHGIYLYPSVWRETLRDYLQTLR